MPILRKNGQRLYFVHLPMTPINNLYLDLLSHGYDISNLGPRVGDIIDQHTGFSKSLFERFQIRSFQKEGEMERITGSMQFATYDAWCHWGPFDYSFAVVRDPMERFADAVKAQYRVHLSRNKIEHNSSVFASFQLGMLDYLRTKHPRKQSAFDNLFRTMMSFILPQTRLYDFSGNGLKSLADDLGLSDIHCRIDNSFVLTDTDLIDAARVLYEDDIAFYRENLTGGVVA